MSSGKVDLSSHLPAYRQIEDILKEQIKSGSLQPFAKVWSERIISERFQVSRMTARKAIGNLVNEGYLFTQNGKGTFVSDRIVSQPILKLKNFCDEMNELGLNPHTQILEYEEFQAGPRMSSELQVSEDTKLFRIQRLMFANEIPYSVETKCLVFHKCKVLTLQGEHDDELLDFISGKCHRCVTRFDVFIEATSLCERESALLGMAPGKPALCIRKYASDPKGERISVVKSIFRGDLYRLHSTAEY